MARVRELHEGEVKQEAQQESEQEARQETQQGRCGAGVNSHDHLCLCVSRVILLLFIVVGNVYFLYRGTARLLQERD